MKASPHSWEQQAQSLWDAGDHQGAIQTILAVINPGIAQGELPRVPCLRLVYYMFQLGDFVSAEKVLSDLLEKYPEDLEVLENRAVMRIRSGAVLAAIEDFQVVVRENSTSVNAWDGLTHALYKAEKWPEATQAGEQALTLKAQLSRPTSRQITWPSLSPQDWDEQQNQKQDAIAFSLWGSNPRYLRGAVRNLLEAPTIYPGWQCRFYVDETVPPGFIDFVRSHGGFAIVEQPHQTLRQKLSWRFQVANDPTVRRFLVRDADSVISQREAQAVAEWLASDRWFHIMRDYWTHTDLILAGMWGGRSGLLPELMPMLQQYKSGKLETPNIDQWFLRDCIWPIIHEGAFIHDRIFRTPNSHPWPSSTPTDNFHVGQCEATARAAEQVAKLEDLVPKYPWLQIANGATANLSTMLAQQNTSGVELMEIRITAIPTVIITMATEKKRNQHIQELCTGLDLQWQFIESIACNPAYFGCTVGHLKALLLARRNKQIPCLVLENDCDSTEFFRSKIQVPVDSDIVYIGTSACGCVPQMNYIGVRGCALVEAVDGTDLFYRVRNMTSTHAMLYVSAKGLDMAIKSILESIALSRPIDVGYIVDLQGWKSNLNIYCTRSPWLFQSAQLQTKAEIAAAMQLMTLEESPHPRALGDTVGVYSAQQPAEMTRLKLIAGAIGIDREWTISEFIPSSALDPFSLGNAKIESNI